MTTRNPRRSKWTKEVVEAMWAEMTTYQHTRRRGNGTEWWNFIAQALNNKFTELSLTGRACANKACEVAKAGRDYPWNLSVERGAPEKPTRDFTTQRIEDTLFQLIERIDRLETTLVGLIEDRLVPSPDVAPEVGQLWTTQARAADGQRLTMRITQIAGDGTVTLEEIGVQKGGFVYALPKRRLISDFAFVGVAKATPLAVATVAPPPPPPAPKQNGQRRIADLSELM